jgi:hypothetical protein
MKRFQVKHRVGMAFIEAERHQIEGHLHLFYDGPRVVAQFATTAVARITELTSDSSRRLFSEFPGRPPPL